MSDYDALTFHDETNVMVKGVNLSVGGSMTPIEMTGFYLGGVSTIVIKINGVSITGLHTVAEKMKGVTISGL